MQDFYDRLENRTQAARETALFRDLRHVLAISKPRVPSMRAQLKGIDVNGIMRRGDLAGIPLLRRSDLVAAQAEGAGLGGYAATRLSGLAQVFSADDGALSPEGHARDWFGVARALYAAGLRKGTLVLNCCAYDLVPFGHMIAAGARAIGCPVVPAGEAPLERVLAVASRLRPRFFCGSAERLKSLLDAAADNDADMSCLTIALVVGATAAGLRSELELRGIAVRQGYLIPELGLVAYESGQSQGLILNEGLILEIVRGQTDDAEPSRSDGSREDRRESPADAADGELVVTRINTDYPLLRYATGAVSRILREGSPCGRTNTVIRAPQENAAAIEGGGDIGRTHLAEIARRHPNIGRMRLFVRRPRGQDVLHLKVEIGRNEPQLGARLSETLQAVTRLDGTVEIVEPGSLPDDEAAVVDERPSA